VLRATSLRPGQHHHVQWLEYRTRSQPGWKSYQVCIERTSEHSIAIAWQWMTLFLPNTFKPSHTERKHFNDSWRNISVASLASGLKIQLHSPTAATAAAARDRKTTNSVLLESGVGRLSIGYSEAVYRCREVIISCQ